MRLIYLYIFLHCLAHVKCCHLSEISGDILGCIHDDKEIHVDPAHNNTVASGSVCIIETQLGVQHVECESTHWIIDREVYRTETHVRRKRGWFSRAVRVVGKVVRGVVNGVVCVATLFTVCSFGDRRPSDQTRPDIQCASPEIFVTAEPLKYVARATWKEPTANDETDGHITPRRRSGFPSGENFLEGKTIVRYEAKDRSGNRASCDITVNVKVVRCDPPKHINNGYYQCYPVTDHLNGGRCYFGCYEGYDLHGGPNHVSCTETGKWSNSQPICKPWKCPDLPQLDGAGKPNCTDGSNFRSICTFNCDSGFDMPPKVSKALVCDKTKSWRMFGTPKCVDVEPPSFRPGTCPSIVIAGTDTGVNSTKVSWKLPEIIDNSNHTIRESKSVYSPGNRLTAGIYSVKYGARDGTGNIALNDCSFKVIVREIRCSKLYPTPYLHINCPHGYRTGARCDISCDPGKDLVGSDYVGCNRNGTAMYGIWNWKGKMQSQCINGRDCVALPPPTNGAVVCDNWEGGQFCQIQCKNGTQMSSVSLKKIYVCQMQSGEWSRKPSRVKTCRAVNGHNRHQHLGLEVYYYFDGDCTDPETQNQIANNFIENIKANLLYQAEVCPNSIECNKGNVQITCGASNRKKRDSDSNTVLILTAKIPISLRDSESLYVAEEIYTKLLYQAQDVLTNNLTAIFGNVPVSLKEFLSKGLQIDCPEGSVKSEQSIDCIDCPEGTFYTKEYNTPVCQVCRKGYFQNNVAQLSCLRCPHGTTTHAVGASSVHECEEACGPGSFSSDGLLPCTPCEQGFYQASYGQSFCRPCRGSKSTLTFGANSASDCEEFDIQLIDGDQSNIHATLQNNVTIKDFTLAFWYQNTANSNFSLNKYPTVTFYDIDKKAQWTWEGFRDVTQKNIKIISTVQFELPADKRWHYITLYSTSKCSISAAVDSIALPVVDTPGNCTDVVLKTLSIAADNQTSGSISQVNIWHGKHLADYRHRCFSNDIGNVFSWKTMEEAEILGAFVDIPSQCDAFDNCVSSPCRHGSCTDVLHGFSCTCDKGYLGTQCEVNIDDCEANICMNNATCIDGVGNYSCSCPPNFTGDYCEITMVDGEWSEWGNWSECSTTCGDGEKKRKRLCNSPTPDNGGEFCHGDAFDFINCNNSECPVCPELLAPANGSLDCVNDTESINCTISCDDGFDFDIEPLPLYYCGPDTFQEWSYQTDENPERRLPRCVEIELPEEIMVEYSAHYEDLYCANEDLEDFAKEEIELRVNAALANVPCLVKGTCSLNYINIIDCDRKSKDRRRRAMETTAGFSLQIKANPTQDNKNETMSGLEDAFQNIQNAADSGDFTVQVLDDDYKLMNNYTKIHGDVRCGPGQIKVKFYCVPCGEGSYLNTDICKPCPVGSYQDHEGQSSCVKCPKGKSTIGIQSTNINECIVDVIVPLEEGLKEHVNNSNKESCLRVVVQLKVTGIIVGCLSALVVITLSIFIYRRYKSKQAKLVNPTDINMVSQQHLSQKNGKLGEKNKHFESTSLTYQSSSSPISQVDSDDGKVTPDTENAFRTIRSSTFISDDGKIFHSKPWR